MDGDYAVVQTTIPLAHGDTMPLDYRMHQTSGRWQVYDLSIDGISLVANYRAQFNKIIRTVLVRGPRGEAQVEPGRIFGALGVSARRKGRAVTAGQKGDRQWLRLSLTGRLLQRVVRLCCARPALTVFVAFAFAALGVGYAAHSLTLETSKFHLLPLHQRYATLYKDYAEDFGQLEDIVVVVQSPASRPPRPTRPAWPSVLRDGALGTARISYRIDAQPPRSAGPAVPAARHAARHPRHVASQEDLLADFAAAPTLDRLVEGINQSIGATFLPGAFGPGASDDGEHGSHAPARRSPDPDVGADRRPAVPLALGRPSSPRPPSSRTAATSCRTTGACSMS